MKEKGQICPTINQVILGLEALSSKVSNKTIVANLVEYQPFMSHYSTCTHGTKIVKGQIFLVLSCGTPVCGSYSYKDHVKIK